MKISIFLITLLCFTSGLNAQELKKLESEYKGDANCKDNADPKLLSTGAFNKFMTDHYAYTILGSLSPATGIKVETEKPSITLKGNIITSKDKSFITTLELTAGVDNNFMNIFSDNKVSSVFKAAVGFNFLYNGQGSLLKKFNNIAKYYSKDSFLECYLFNNSVYKYDQLALVSDSIKVVKALMDIEFIEKPSLAYLDKLLSESKNEELKENVKYLEKLKRKKEVNKKKSNKYDLRNEEISSLRNELIEDTVRLQKITLGILKSFGFKYREDLTDDLLAEYAATWKSNEHREGKEKLLQKYNQLMKLDGQAAVDSLYTYEIQAASTYWTTKRIVWFNISPSISNANFILYDSSAKSVKDESNLLMGIKGSINGYWKYKQPHRYLYLIVSASAQKVSTIEELKSLNYKKTTQIKISETETLTKDDPQTGYLGPYRTGFGWDSFAEGYYVPWKKAFIPGFYAKVHYRHSADWITPDKLSLAAGLVWNVKNGDKDSKNLLTIVPYAKWSNVLKEYKNDIGSSTVALHDLFSAGVQIGIPINLGK